ncbi:MAG: HupE/UreJ family protein [Alcanivoracaceae bacterium]|nr:HupE/UreJ family protein [Alcanivoracaceae bacterium]
MTRALLLLLCLISTSVWAHKPSDSYLKLDSASDTPRINGQWDIALRDLQLVIDLDRNNDLNITWGELRQSREQLQNTVLASLTLQAVQEENNYSCPLTLTTLQVDDHSDGRYAVVSFIADCEQPPQQLLVEYQFLFSQDPSHHGLLNFRHNGDTLSTTFSHDSRRQQLRINGASLWSAFVGFVGQGIHHILIGYDHILFLITLLLPAVLYWQHGRWYPTHSMASALTQTLGIVTAFTASHSLTLAMATFGWITLPSWLVESAIAATVAFGAVTNFYPRLFPKRWLMALIFGLIHGLGFASVLADLGLTGSGIFWPLLGFNIGVELGQMAIVLVFIPIAFALRYSRFYQRGVMQAGSIMIIALASFWLVERLTSS